MAFEKRDGIFHTFRASTGLKQYQFVNFLSTAGNTRIGMPTTNGVSIGVLVSSGTTGSTGRAGSTDSGSVQTVQLAGISKVLCGTTKVAPGGFVKAATDGRAAQTTGPTSTSYLGGIALEDVASTSTSGQIVPVILNPTVGFNA